MSKERAVFFTFLFVYPTSTWWWPIWTAETCSVQEVAILLYLYVGFGGIISTLLNVCCCVWHVLGVPGDGWWSGRFHHGHVLHQLYGSAERKSRLCPVLQPQGTEDRPDSFECGKSQRFYNRMSVWAIIDIVHAVVAIQNLRALLRAIRGALFKLLCHGGHVQNFFFNVARNCVVGFELVNFPLLHASVFLMQLMSVSAYVLEWSASYSSSCPI
jgi:hypothetical protein